MCSLPWSLSDYNQAVQYFILVLNIDIVENEDLKSLFLEGHTIRGHPSFFDDSTISYRWLCQTMRKNEKAELHIL
jgi:hypothetical protein